MGNFKNRVASAMSYVQQPSDDSN